jgi:rare lipoprotein A
MMKSNNRRGCRGFVASATCLFLPLAAIPAMDIEFQTVASWYGPGFQGRRTASGELFDQNKLTAASRTLPFGTKLTVKNLQTGRSCDVVINDRGPYVRGRGLDLSLGAARRIGMVGVGPVLCYNAGSAKHLSTPRIDNGKDAGPATDTDDLVHQQNLNTAQPEFVAESLEAKEAKNSSGARHRVSQRPTDHRSNRIASRYLRDKSVQYIAYEGSHRIQFGRTIDRVNNRFVHTYGPIRS